MRALTLSFLLSGVSGIALLWPMGQTKAGCAPAPTIGNDTIVCSSATPPEPTMAPVNLLAGNDTITVNSGALDGGITGGAGTKTVNLLGGSIASYLNTVGTTSLFMPVGSTATITGTVTFGAGNDTLEVHSGSIGGHVEQGDGLDTFVMTGGQMQSLDQGGGLDTATISGGRIIGAFNDGDFFTMSGGRVGSVDLRVANNVMIMSGGTIDGNVNAEQGADRLELSGGSIGGSVDFGNGNNTITVTGGSIGAGIVTGTGTDSFTWRDAGNVTGAVNLGAGSDGATLQNLTAATLSSLTLLDGGTGAGTSTDTDTLTFNNTQTAGSARFQNWESIALTNGSRVTLDANLVLGNAGSTTRALSIDGTSALLVGNGVNPVISSATADPLTVTNAGLIDFTNGGGATANSLTIQGDYVGNGGRMTMRTMLGSDGSASDRLIISGGQASGTTGIAIVNAGGAGAQTSSDGILVVQAVNGGITQPGSFGLANAVAAGAYEYLLFRGGAAPGTSDNWYLRSTIIPTLPPPVPPAPPPAVPPPQSEVPPPAVPPTPVPPAAAAGIPLFRPEVAVYSAVSGVVREVGRQMIGTFHERQGDQSLLRGTGAPRAAWGRAFGGRTTQGWTGDVAPEFKGTVGGFQAGTDVWTFESSDGRQDRFGFFVGFARASGSVRGFAIGQQDVSVGKVAIEGTNIGGYWTSVGPSGWYVDALVMGTRYDTDPRSNRGVSGTTAGHGVAATIEAGYPIPVAPGWALEPQGQVIWQHVSLDEFNDVFSSVGYRNTDAATGRVGLRLQGQFVSGGNVVQPYLKANLWHDFAGTSEVIFAAVDVIGAQRKSTALEVGGGAIARIGQGFSLYATADYTTDLGSETRRIVKGNAGLRVTW